MKPNIRDSVIPQLWRDASTWKFRYRHAGRARTLTLGAYPLLTPQAARRACQVAGALVAVGRCPATERRALAAETRLAKKPVVDTIERASAQYLKYHRARVRASTYCETQRSFDKNILPAWHGKRLSAISKNDVRVLVASIARRAPVGGNRVLTSLKAFFSWAVSEDLISVSPAAAIKPPAPETARERVLDDSELASVWRASMTLGQYGAGVRLLALTGARRSEVFDATWQEFDMTARVWTLPSHRAKNNREHSVPLSPQALEVLAWLTPAFEARGMIFETQNFSSRAVELNRLLPRDMPGWVLHDLRRSCASGMAGLGVAPHVIESCLNHKSGQVRGVAAIYNRYQYQPEKKAALDLWADHVGAILAAPAFDLVAA